MLDTVAWSELSSTNDLGVLHNRLWNNSASVQSFFHLLWISELSLDKAVPTRLTKLISQLINFTSSEKQQ